MTTSTVLVAGAGIAGLTASLALARAGLPVTLVERRGGFSEVGAGLQLSPNAAHVLIGLGLSAGMARIAVAPQRLDIRRWGDPRAFAGMTMDGDRAAPFWTVKRADLQTVLLDAVRMQPNIRMIVGRELLGFAETAAGVAATVQTARGQREVVEAAALIGADGLWSSVRAALAGPAEPAFLGYEAWRTLIPIETVEDFARAPSVGLWLGRGRHAVHYPVSAGRELNVVLVRAGQNAAKDWDGAADAADLAPLLAQASPTLRKLLSAAPAWRRWSLFDSPAVLMGRGRVALAGDAAHPVLPFMAQGAALAIEDAAVLAHELAAGLDAGGPERAIAAYARARAARARKVQQTARTNARAYHAGGLAASLRDFGLGRLGDAGMRRRYDWIYGWRAPGC
jgi:salicylate hydroxylase